MLSWFYTTSVLGEHDDPEHSLIFDLMIVLINFINPVYSLIFCNIVYIQLFGVPPMTVQVKCSYVFQLNTSQNNLQS